jgi:hypothetical protein
MSTNTQTTLEFDVAPKKIKARTGKYQVNIKNQEKQDITYQLKAADASEMCTYKFNKDTVNVAPGANAVVTLTVSFKKTPLLRTPKVCNFTVTAIKSTGKVITAEGQLECPSFLPLWAMATGALVVVAVIAVVVVLAYGGNNGSTETTTNTSVVKNPTTSATTKTPSTSTIPASTSGTQTSTTTSTNPNTDVTTTTVSTPTTATTTTTSTTPTQPTNILPNLNGVWTFAIKVTEAYGACAGEDGGPANNRQITITQTGQNITLAGFLGNPANTLTGTIADQAGIWVINVSGSYSEDGGTTTSSHRLEVKSTSEMSGVEDWSWTGPGGTCPGGKASVAATRVSGP